jgi:hypothetical protein
MSAPAYEYEWEAVPEGPAHEWEGEYESSSLEDLGAGVLRDAALGAGGAALEVLGEMEGEMEGETEGVGELNPVRKVYSDAALEHLAHNAMMAEGEAEAGEAFLPLIPMVASRLLPLAARALPAIGRALPRVMSAVSRITPQLTRGVTRIAGRLFRNPQTRRLLRAVPSIARRTIGTLARRVAHGAPLTPQLALRTLARSAVGVLGHRRRLAGTVRRSHVLDRVYHRSVAPALGVAPAPGRAIYAPPGAPAGGRVVYAPHLGRTVVVPAGRRGVMRYPRRGGCCGCSCCSCPCCGR